MAKELGNVLRLCPYDARANLRMAAICLRQFEQKQQYADNVLGLNSIRDAALASNFASRHALDRWLAVAVGEHRRKLDEAAYYARRAVSLCPVQGDGYVYLGELCFLQGFKDGQKAALTKQALRVRPYKGSVLLAAAQEASMRGNVQQAFAYWKKTFHREKKYRQVVIQALGDQLPLAVVVSLLEPQLDDLLAMYTYFHEAQRLEQAKYLAERYQVQLQHDQSKLVAEKAAKSWATAFWLHHQLNSRGPAMECIRQAVRIDPEDWTSRKTLALVLLQAGHGAESYAHLQWCLRRRPDDRELHEALRVARRLEVAGSQ